MFRQLNDVHFCSPNWTISATFQLKYLLVFFVVCGKDKERQTSHLIHHPTEQMEINSWKTWPPQLCPAASPVAYFGYRLCHSSIIWGHMSRASVFIKKFLLSIVSYLKQIVGAGHLQKQYFSLRQRHRARNVQLISCPQASR